MALTRRRFLLVAGGSAAGLGAGAAFYERHRLEDTLDPPHGADARRADGTAAIRDLLVPCAPAHSAMGGGLAARQPARAISSHVALVLHGRGDDSRSAFAAQGLQHFLAAAVRAGTPPFALASIDGGDHTYWHARADGDDPQTMLTQEFVPLLQRMGLRGERFGLTGWSMGGYGALLLAARVPVRVQAVATDAAALWQRPGDTAPGAFDGPSDLRAQRHLHAYPSAVGNPATTELRSFGSVRGSQPCAADCPAVGARQLSPRWSRHRLLEHHAAG